MYAPQAISGKPIWLGFHAARGSVDTGGHRYCLRVFGAVEIRGTYESWMGPYLPRVRRTLLLLMSLYPRRTALWSSNQSAISRRDWGFLTGWSSFRYMERLMDRGWDPILPSWSWLNIRTPANRRSAGGVGISTPCGEVSTRMISVFVPGLSEL